MVSSVFGRTRTRRSSGGGSSPVTVGESVAELLQLRLGHLVARRGRQGQGLEVRRARSARSAGPRPAAADATARSGPASGASEASSSARSIAWRPGLADSSPMPKSTITGPTGGHEDVAGAQRPMREPGRVEGRHLAPDRVEELVVDLVGVELVEAARRRCVRGRAPSSRRAARRAHRPPGQSHARPRGEDQQEGLVLDVVGERRRRPARRPARGAPASGSRGRAGRRRGCPGRRP